MEKSLSEIKRVLKPDGILIFCEHGLAPDYKISKWQNILTPISKKLAGGCCLNKNIYTLIQNNGFKFENINNTEKTNIVMKLGKKELIAPYL